MKNTENRLVSRLLVQRDERLWMLPSGGIVPLILLVPFRTPRGGKRLGGGFPGSFFGFGW